MRKAIDFLLMVRAWFTFHGWRNSYWREDWYMTLCDHPANARYIVADTHDQFCIVCGRPMP